MQQHLKLLLGQFNMMEEMLVVKTLSTEFSFQNTKKGKRSKVASADEEQTAKNQKERFYNKINSKAPKLLSDILCLCHDKQVKKYGKNISDIVMWN